MHPTHSRSAFVAAAMIALALPLASASCGQDRSSFGDGSGTFAADAGEAAVPCDQVRCSPDLHSVVSACDGTVLRRCPDDQGCGNGGTCVPSCDSAADALGTPGCSFWAAPPPAQCATRGSCFAMIVANTWSAPADLTVEYEGVAHPVASFARIPKVSADGRNVDYLPLEGPLPPGGQAILFLFSAPQQTCMGPPPIECPAGVRPLLLGTEEYLHKTPSARLSAFGLRASVPVAAYSMYPYGGAASYVPSATLLYPEATLAKNYVALNAWGDSGSLHLVGTQDDTTITLIPSNDLATDLVSGPQSFPVTMKVKRGETIQLADTDDTLTYGFNSVRLNGSAILSDKPIAVYGGTSCTDIGPHAACDSALQQLPPVASWGSYFAAVSYGGRQAAEETVPWRILAAVDGTVLTYDPEPPTGAPTTMSGRQLVTTSASRPFTVKSQDKDHPIFVSGHMTGGQDFGGDGDPEFVTTVPVDQFLDAYTFFVDYTYASSRLVIVRADDGSGFQDVTIDCVGVVQGFQPLGSSGKLQYARVDLNHNGVDALFDGVACGRGRRSATSKGRFGITVWGWDQYASYAYPAGASVRPLSSTTVGVVR